jgi:hypothetical protein
MTTQIYNCKREEVPVIGRYILFPLKRDFNDFSTFLPKIFTNDYIPNLERKIDEVNNLLNPQIETVELKNTTNRLYLTMDGLIDPANRLAGYVNFAKNAVQISAKDFGLTPLKRRIHARDAEGVLQNLRLVIANIEKYRPQLVEYGLSEDIVERFTQALTAIETDNQQQFEIVSRRKTIVENNMAVINDLYKTIIEVCNVGKTLYKGKNDMRVKDYTFNELKKKVRIN